MVSRPRCRCRSICCGSHWTDSAWSPVTPTPTATSNLVAPEHLPFLCRECPEKSRTSPFTTKSTVSPPESASASVRRSWVNWLASAATPARASSTAKASSISRSATPSRRAPRWADCRCCCRPLSLNRSCTDSQRVRERARPFTERANQAFRALPPPPPQQVPSRTSNSSNVGPSLFLSFLCSFQLSRALRSEWVRETLTVAVDTFGAASSTLALLFASGNSTRWPCVGNLSTVPLCCLLYRCAVLLLPLCAAQLKSNQRPIQWLNKRTTGSGQLSSPGNGAHTHLR